MRDDLPDPIPPEIPCKFRAIAAVLHASFAIPMGLSVAFYLWILLSGSQLSGKDSQVLTILLYFIFVSLPMTLIWPLISWIIWKISSFIHPFVDLAGRDALNYALGNLILTICLTIALTVASTSLYMVPYFYEVSFGILNFVVAAFVMNSIVAGSLAFRGDRYRSLLIYSFVRDK